jgi:hypothetical protein
MMTPQKIDRIECAIRHIQTSADVDPWAVEIAVEALEKQMPKKPNETTDTAWGIPCRQAVCPECDCFLGQVHFLGDGKQKIAYCERCGQAVDFSEWEEDE